MNAIDADIFGDGDEHQEHYRIDGIRAADWAIRKLAQHRKRRQEQIDLVNDEALRLNAWLIEATADDERSITYFESILRNFHAELLAEDPKRKTIIPLGVAS